MARLVVQVADPLGKLARVGDGGRQKHVVNVVWQQDDRLLPYHTTL